MKPTQTLEGQSCKLPPELSREVRDSLAAWGAGDRMRRLWDRDASLWTGRDEARWLGWLDVVGEELARAAELRAFAEEIRSEGFDDALVLGMGGSSLCPEVMARTFGAAEGYPRLHVLDSTDPEQVAGFERKLDLRRTLFIVSSKSGTTLESNILKAHFFDRLRHAAGERAGRNFVAITDPGSKLDHEAKSDGFRRVFHGVPEIGGRYSALSRFGMLPSALLGLDVAKVLQRADAMVQACGAAVPAEENPGCVLGTVLGVLARAGRDKVTIAASPEIESVGAWLEQLLAESTGKDGKALIPVDGERLAPPGGYGDDRLFVYLRLEGEADQAQDAVVDALESGGQPVLRVSLRDRYDLGREFVRWEVATAVAGAILGVNPFDQPDVEASKVASRRLTDEYERTGALPAEMPRLEENGLALFTDDGNASALRSPVGADGSVVRWLRGHIARLNAGDYFALLAYVAMRPEHERTLQDLRHAVRDARRVATCLGFGPRFLHSTGQAYKGGPNTGVFLQVTCDDAVDVPVPGRRYTFGVVKAAQARGDFEVLAERGRRALRAHIGTDVEAGLAKLREAVGRALQA